MNRLTCPGARLVVQVTPYYPPHLGGAENVAWAIANGLAEHCAVEVLTSTAGTSPLPSTERAENLLVRRLFTLEFAHLSFMPTLLLRLLRLPRSAAVHVHVTQAYVAEMVWLAAVLRRRPFVAHFHGDVEPSGRLGALFVVYKRWILGRTLRAAEQVIVLSDHQVHFIAERYGVLRERLAVVPNAVGPEFFREPSQTPDHDGPFRLLWVGRLARQKNVSRLLEAVAAVSLPVELVIVGDGDQRAILEHVIRDLGLTTVRMVGAVYGEELVGWYRWADAFVLSSNSEGMPLALLEAMASGLPIVGTDVPGIADTVGADALLAPPDPTALARGIERLILDPILRADLARRGYERAKRHGSMQGSQGLETLSAIYESLTGVR